MANCELPEVILVEIFSHLPPKTVGKCRCLAKTWRSLLSTPQFLESHFTRKPHQENLILITPSHSIATVNDTVYKDLDFPIRACRFEGSCGGLVLLTNLNYDKFLLNPVTLEHVELPNSPLDVTRDFEYSATGFGYDRLRKDYKVVTLSHYDTDESDCSGTFVDVYSVKFGVWKRWVYPSPYGHQVVYLNHGAFVNGALHWIAFSRRPSYRYVIASFNLADMMFGEMPLPSGFSVKQILLSRLVILGGCLCVIDNHNHNNIGTDIWIMKDYGAPDSWTTKLCVEVDHDWERLKPLCYTGNEGIVLLTDDDETSESTLVDYTLKDTTLWQWLVHDVPVMCLDAGAFVQSLVSPAAAAAGQRV